MKKYILFTAFVALFVSCLNTPDKKSKSDSEFPNGVAKEVLQTSNYTYFLLDIDGKETWIAGPSMEASAGTKYYYIENMKMENFQSKELNRFFDVIVFATKVSDNPESFTKKVENNANYQADVKTTKQDVKIVLGKGITSIADVYSNKDKYKGTELTVKGVVTKFNAEIMGKNWLHLQDGTEKDGHFDLVITTSVTAKVGDTLTLSGKLALDKDFGYGYKYDALIEDANKK